MITAARADSGIYVKYGVRTIIDSTTRAPVHIPPAGVLTPDCEFIAVLNIIIRSVNKLVNCWVSQRITSNS